MRWPPTVFALILVVLPTPGGRPLPAMQPRTSDGTVGVAVERTRTLCQKLVSVENACVPVTVLNALRFGPPEHREALARFPGGSDAEKVSHLIDAGRRAPSAVEPGQTVFRTETGVRADDFLPLMRTILKGRPVDELSGTYFDVLGREKPADHLRRVHRMMVHSLRAGIPVVTSVRSFGAVQRGRDFVWEGLAAHAVLVVRVPAEIGVDAQGFVFQFVEPSTGLVREGYCYFEDVRGFQAVKGAGEKHFTWIDKGFLHVLSPALVLETGRQPWYMRTFMTLNYGVGKFPR